MRPAGYSGGHNSISEEDACSFMRVWDAGKLKHSEGGIYLYARQGSRDQFFWSGSKSISPRPFSLWHEPIITVGAIGDLHFDYRWPWERLQSQSRDAAFDLIALGPNLPGQHIAGEVKKSVAELELLAEYMSEYAADPTAKEPKDAKARNAFRKATSVRINRPKYVWLVGPSKVGKLFETHFSKDNAFGLIERSEEELQFC